MFHNVNKSEQKPINIESGDWIGQARGSEKAPKQCKRTLNFLSRLFGQENPFSDYQFKKKRIQ